MILMLLSIYIQGSWSSPFCLDCNLHGVLHTMGVGGKGEVMVLKLVPTPNNIKTSSPWGICKPSFVTLKLLHVGFTFKSKVSRGHTNHKLVNFKRFYSYMAKPDQILKTINNSTGDTKTTLVLKSYISLPHSFTRALDVLTTKPCYASIHYHIWVQGT